MSSRPDRGKYIPECPFCGRQLPRPANRVTEFGEVLCADCGCGAICVCDPTGRNIGEAHMEALALLQGSWEIGSLDPDRDYRIEEMDYDMHTHSRIYQKGQATRSGKLVIIKASSESAPPREAGDDEARAGDRDSPGKGGGMRLKKRVRELLASKSFDEIVALAPEDKGIMRVLISLSYDKDDIMTWRAIEAIGLISPAYRQGNLPLLRETIRKMIWSMTDEAGAIGWSAPEIMGEIVRSDPDEFSDIIPIVWSFREEGLFRENVLWAMGRIAEARPDLVAFTMEELPGMLDDPHPAIRAYALRLLRLVGGAAPGRILARLREDQHSVRFYEGGEFVTKTIAELAGG